MMPDNLNPLQWHQAIGVARQSCARVFRDGGAPIDALEAFGLRGKRSKSEVLSWDKAVELIAEALCRVPSRRAA
jgi:hypothetical protein